jgi:hypothetical protein
MGKRRRRPWDSARRGTGEEQRRTARSRQAKEGYIQLVQRRRAEARKSIVEDGGLVIERDLDEIIGFHGDDLGRRLDGLALSFSDYGVGILRGGVLR